MSLAQYEHRHKSCSRSVITDNGSSTVIEYSCPGGGFGRSKLTMITPRSLRIETQGISEGLIRLSVGVEPVERITGELAKGLRG